MYLDLGLFVGICIGIVGGVANVIARKGPPLLAFVVTLTGPGCAGPGPVFEGGDAVPIAETGAGGEAGATVEDLFSDCVEDCD